MIWYFKIILLITFILITALFIIYGFFPEILPFFHGWTTPTDFPNFGAQFGFMSAIFSAGSVWLLIYTLILQHEDQNQQRKELMNQRLLSSFTTLFDLFQKEPIHLETECYEFNHQYKKEFIKKDFKYIHDVLFYIRNKYYGENKKRFLFDVSKKISCRKDRFILSKFAVNLSQKVRLFVACMIFIREKIKDGEEQQFYYNWISNYLGIAGKRVMFWICICYIEWNNNKKDQYPFSEKFIKDIKSILAQSIIFDQETIVDFFYSKKIGKEEVYFYQGALLTERATEKTQDYKKREMNFYEFIEMFSMDEYLSVKSLFNN